MKKILTANNLSKRGWRHKTTCPLCQLNQEDTSHLLEYRAMAKEEIDLYTIAHRRQDGYRGDQSALLSGIEQ
jgi:hypothetical protein